ncbi:MAG: acetyl-CoA acetyltransferase [Acidimicrobiales bacterium]
MTGAVDPRQPVLVGAGQLSNRVDRGAPPLEPADLMAEALRLAEADSGGTGLLAKADAVRVINELSWRYRNCPALVAERVGASPRQVLYTVMGGNYVQTLVNRSALDIANGDADVILLAGGEAWRTRTAARKADHDLGWTEQPEDTPPPEHYGSDESLSAPEEVARGVFMPVQLYPIFEVALRAAGGLGVEEHRARIAGLWSRFSEVAASNPHAWIQQAFTPAEIATPSPDNRMVGFPYTKRMNSNNMVEQGAALIMCSAAAAEAAGVPRDRWVFPHAGTDAHDHWFVSQRENLHSSPAIRLAGRTALELAGIGPDDLAHVDLYSCFPSAVQIAADELGLGLDRQLTVTGGLSFAGGPWNNYVMHGIATMTAVLRDDPGAVGLCSANGGYITKHAFGVYGTEPPADGFRWRDLQDQVDALPRREVLAEHDGPVTIEAYTVMHDRDGAPEAGLVASLTADGRRMWANTHDDDLMRAMCDEEWVGRTATVAADGALHPS